MIVSSEDGTAKLFLAGPWMSFGDVFFRAVGRIIEGHAIIGKPLA